MDRPNVTAHRWLSSDDDCIECMTCGMHVCDAVTVDVTDGAPACDGVNGAAGAVYMLGPYGLERY